MYPYLGADRYLVHTLCYMYHNSLSQHQSPDEHTTSPEGVVQPSEMMAASRHPCCLVTFCAVPHTLSPQVQSPFLDVVLSSE